MKSARDPRHQKRREAVKELFASTFTSQKTSALTRAILKEEKGLDKKIEKSAPLWPLTKLNRIDLAVLRLATYEITHKLAPEKVVIDEAVELAKEYGSEASPAFVNGVLGDMLKNAKKVNS